MDWNCVEGNWKEMKGKIKEQWGRLTDDDLDVIDGKQDQLEGRLQQRYGYAKDQAKKENPTPGQVAGLGSSEMARRFAIGSKGEAAAYLAHDVFRARASLSVLAW